MFLKYVFYFVDNGAVSKKKLWSDGVHKAENGRVIIENGLIKSLIIFKRLVNSVLQTS